MKNMKNRVEPKTVSTKEKHTHNQESRWGCKLIEFSIKLSVPQLLNLKSEGAETSHGAWHFGEPYKSALYGRDCERIAERLERLE